MLKSVNVVDEVRCLVACKQWVILRFAFEWRPLAFDRALFKSKSLGNAYGEPVCRLGALHLLFSQEVPFTIFWSILVCAARSCKQNIYDQNLFDDEANISFHFEANKFVAFLAIEGKRLNRDYKMVHAFAFSLATSFSFSFVGISVTLVHIEKFPSTTSRKQVLFT